MTSTFSLKNKKTKKQKIIADIMFKKNFDFVAELK